MDTFLISLLVIAACFILLYLFSRTKKTIESERAVTVNDAGSNEYVSVVRQEISKLPVPPMVQAETSKVLANIIGQEVHKKTATLAHDIGRQYAKMLDEKDTQVKNISYKYEAVNRKYEQIGREKKQTESVVRSLAEGLVVVNEKGETLLMNPAAEKLLGMKKTEMVGKNILSSQKEGQVISLAAGAPAASEKEITLNSSDDNTKKIIRASTAVIENESGQTVGMVSVLTDITKQKELDEMKDKFVANVSHELRTPLNCIKESINLLSEQVAGEVNDEQKKILTLAAKNIERLSLLIHDLLDIAKLESKEYKLSPSTFRLEDLLHHVKATFDPWAKSKGLTLEVKATPDVIEIEADHDKVNQILTNLIGNALKFTPVNGKITTEAKLMLADETYSKGYVQISVQDTGIGIPKDEQKQIFEKFVQGRSSQKVSAKGTGLGLAICREIVELHGGRIWVESEDGKGSKFIFAIPQRRNQNP